MTQADITQQRLNYLKRWSNDCFFFMFREIYINMDGKKIYQIQINGIKESTDAVSALNKQLDALEQRIKTLESKNVKVNTSSSGSKSTMDEEAKLAKQIEQTDAKREAYSKKIYQNYLAAKDVLDETVKDQKTIAASERLQANNYTNTMKGMKQELSDLKIVMNGTDLGDEKFVQMSKRAGELTAKLKELESQYGQFGRNVGNYQSAFQGLDKITLEVGGVTREFGSAREAAKTLKNELTALELQGKSNTKEAKELRGAFYNLKSAMDDATKSSEAMDRAMDLMESFTAIGSVGNGLKAFFGFDDNEITKSIQKLVALQSVLQGIEVIRKQMDTSEGIGALLAKGSQGVDKFVASITAAEIGVNGLVKGSRLATVAVRSLSIALKGLGIGLIIAALSGLMQIVEKAGGAIQNYFKGNADLIDDSHAVKSSIDAENSALEKQRDILNTRFIRGYIDDTQYATRNLQLLTNAIDDNIHQLSMQAIMFSKSSDQLRNFSKVLLKGLGNGEDIKISSDFLDMTTIIKNIDGAKTAWEEFEKAVNKGEDLITANGANSFLEWIGSFVISADDAKDDLAQIGQVIAADWIHNFDSIVADLETGSTQARGELIKLVNELNNDKVTRSVMMNLDKYFDDEKIIAKIQNVIKYAQELSGSFEFDLEIGKGADYWEQVRIDAKTGAEKVRAQIALDKKKELADLQKYGEISEEHRKQIDAKYRRREIEETKQFGQQQRDAQNDLDRLRIEAMKEGEKKELAQLDQEKKEKIQKITQSGILVQKRITAVEELYRKKTLDAEKKWAAERIKVYEDLYQSIQDLNRATFNMEADNASQNIENRSANQKQDVGYSMINGQNFDDSKTLEVYYQKVLEIEKKASQLQAQIRQERLDKELEYDKQEEELRHNRLVGENGEYKQQLEADKITKEQYDKLIEDENNAHYSRMNAIDVQYAAQSEQTVREQLEEEQRLYNEYYANITNDIKKDKQKIDKVMQKQPETDGQGWDVVLALKVKKTYRAVISQYEGLKKDIIAKQKELEIALKEGRISPEDFAMREAELKQEIESIDENIKQVKQRQKELVADFVQSIMPYVQAAMDSFNNIMNAVWDAQDIAFDKEQDEIDKANEALDKALDKQQEIIEQHKSAIDSIEDELATARGDRRQHLIDQINAEIAAQREAQKEEQKIQKQKEAQEKKQEKLDLERKKAEYHRNMLQAIVNGAMAVTFAAINNWPIPAIPMMALAASTTAAQIAIMAANKPYANGGQLDGGVAEGARHKDGGIPVLGGRASIEGGEFITNRQTTAKNVDLLEYINAKHRKLNIDDFIDFYSSGKAKKNFLASNPRQKFADGGIIPTLNNEYTFDDRLLTAFEDYSNREVVVSVVDINNRQAAVKNVQVLAGLTEE